MKITNSPIQHCYGHHLHLYRAFPAPLQPRFSLDNKVHGAYMEPTWGRQDPGGPHVGPMILAIWDEFTTIIVTLLLQRLFLSENIRWVMDSMLATALGGERCLRDFGALGSKMHASQCTAIYSEVS